MKHILPYVIAVFAFLGLSFAFTPQVLENKVVNQSDISSWSGMAREMNTHNQANPDDPALWSDSAFGGMPTYSYGVVLKGDVTKYVYDFLTRSLQRPPVYLFVAMLGAFLMFLAFGVNVWLALVGAIAVAFCSYNMQIIQVGHNTKMIAIAFMPWVLAGVVYTYRRNILLGAVLTAFALSFQIKANHIQISYYLALIIVALVISEFVYALKHKELRSFFLASFALLAAAILGIATNANNLLPLREYTQYTMRGGSELKQLSDGGAAKGLEFDYATAWSYGIEETPNLMIPNFNGGASSGALSKDSNTYKVLRRGYQNPDALIRQMPLYHGPQPFTAGPMYLGAIMIFLSLLGLFVLDGRDKWWIFASGIFMLLLSWGSHIGGFTRLMYNCLPLYNKFRTVSMSLVSLQVLVPLLGVMLVQKVLDGNVAKDRLRKGGIAALALTAGFCLVATLVPGMFGSFVSPADAGLPRDIASALASDRVALLRADALRSLIFILLAAGALVLTYLGKIKQWMCVAALGVLVLVDMWSVDKRYLNDSHFVTKKQFNNVFAARPVDEVIKEYGEYGRVLDLSENTFNSAYTSAHHQSIGGYSPAKLSRYQDLIDNMLHSEIAAVSSEVNAAIKAGAQTIDDVNDALTFHPALAMLDTRYIIIDGDNLPLLYDYAMGPAFCVGKAVVASSAAEEMALLKTVDPRREVVLAGDCEIPELTNPSALDDVRLVSYSPNRLEYRSGADGDCYAVFSEIWYPKGWRAYIDGVEVPILRANYVLRALYLPEGDHTIKFEFRPDTYYQGRTLSMIASLLLVVLLLGATVLTVRKTRH